MQHIPITTSTKSYQYKELYEQLTHILDHETDRIARMSTICSAIKEAFNFYWIGFYRVLNEKELVAGPYIGTLGCLRIQKGKGVCGAAWQLEKTIVVPDVKKFDGHIACSSASKSEIVVPVFKNNQIIAVLDIDSVYYNTFDEIDKEWLERIVELV